MDLHKAHKIAESLIVLAGTSVSRVEIAGSIRRRKPNVKDIELVAIVKDYNKLYGRLSSVGRFIKPGVSDVIDWPPKVGAKYVRMLLNDGIKLDLFIANPDNWGALYCMRTGSASNADGDVYGGFVPAMFKRWKKVSGGGKMSGCQPMMPDGTLLSVLEEQDFFDVCGVAWVDPILRVDSKAVKVIE
jgi:hypothetical protein